MARTRNPKRKAPKGKGSAPPKETKDRTGSCLKHSKKTFSLRNDKPDAVTQLLKELGLEQHPLTAADLLTEPAEEEDSAVLSFVPEKREQLRALQQSAIGALKGALETVGGDPRNIVIITNAKSNWQNESARLLLPLLWNFIHENNIKVISAKDEYMKTLQDQQYLEVTEKIPKALEPGEHVLTRWKRVAFAKWLYDREKEFARERQQLATGGDLPPVHMNTSQRLSTSLFGLPATDGATGTGQVEPVAAAAAAAVYSPPVTRSRTRRGTASAPKSDSSSLHGSASRALSRPCLNVLSVGDAVRDGEALKAVARDRRSWFSWGFVKTLKFRHLPSIEDLTYQLNIFSSSVRSMMTTECPHSTKVPHDRILSVRQRREGVRIFQRTINTTVASLHGGGGSRHHQPRNGLLLSLCTEEAPVLFTPTNLIHQADPVCAHLEADVEEEEDGEEQEYSLANPYSTIEDNEHQQWLSAHTQEYGHVGHEPWGYGGMAEQSALRDHPLPQRVSASTSLYMTSVHPHSFKSHGPPDPQGENTDTIRGQFIQPYQPPLHDPFTFNPLRTPSFTQSAPHFSDASGGTESESPVHIAIGPKCLSSGATPSNYSGGNGIYTGGTSQTPCESDTVLRGQWTTGGGEVQNGDVTSPVSEPSESRFERSPTHKKTIKETGQQKSKAPKISGNNSMDKTKNKGKRQNNRQDDFGTDKATQKRSSRKNASATIASTPIRSDHTPLPPCHDDVALGVYPSESPQAAPMGGDRNGCLDQSLSYLKGGAPSIHTPFSDASSSASASASASSSSSSSASAGGMDVAMGHDDDDDAEMMMEDGE
uniref:Uncharacterized protein n=1 Tax=Chromera velia CCMP2878 TaxID=1169474 RepID=A0A0G4I2B3_9ALVE|eukprot:Cvel_10344.t1-p1 / transcript=Cvel_10344.t1 / gene=Cvel_10344 / organism=Chromera_velia_CCMP2878 / gene_product=hypothetical protein / transcript_product=hypothetical protein / location=Cvel_scaffold621:63844-68036(+) / protein_length=821 / sequence_SO=supercontig / SO=protein_coding / is_pseudo=false